MALKKKLTGKKRTKNEADKLEEKDEDDDDFFQGHEMDYENMKGIESLDV